MGKSIAKKIAKMNKVPHPKGRKTAQLTKKTIQAAGREKTKQQNQMRTNIIAEKILWFKENLKPVEAYTPQLLYELIEKYLNRFNDELKQIELKHSVGKRKGRQHANREDIIRMTIKNERDEFNTCGIELPDILNPKQLNLLKNWSGELRFLQNFKFVRFSKSKLESLKNSGKYGNITVPMEPKKKEDSTESETSTGTVTSDSSKENVKEMEID